MHSLSARRSLDLEHQALLRAAPWRRQMCAAFEAVRRSTLTLAVRRDSLLADVRDMRLRMRKELSRSKAGQFDIKQDAGGIADIEFLVQYWVLAAANSHPQLLTYSDNIRQLEGLAKVKILDDATADWLKEAYIGYRTVLHHLSLEGDGGEWRRRALSRTAAHRRYWRTVFDSTP